MNAQMANRLADAASAMDLAGAALNQLAGDESLPKDLQAEADELAARACRLQMTLAQRAEFLRALPNALGRLGDVAAVKVAQ